MQRRSYLAIVMCCLLRASSIMAQTGDIVPADNLVVENIPLIPASLADEVSRYTGFRAAGLSSWHPTKREMLIGTRFADTQQVHLVQFPGGARTQLTFLKDGAWNASYSPTDGAYFVFNKDVDGNEFYQKYRYDFATGVITLLTDGASRNTGGVWANMDDRIAYGSTRRNGRDVDVWVMNPSAPQSDRMVVQLQGGGWAALDWSPDDHQLLVSEYISINESYLWLIDVATGAKTLITPKDAAEKVAHSGAQFSKDGKGIYVTTDRASEFKRLAYVDLTTKDHSFLTDHIPWDVVEFRLSWDGKMIAFITNEDGLSILHLLDVARGQEQPAPKLPTGIISGLRWHKNSQDLGFGMASARSTSDIYSLDVRTGKVERWTSSETGGMNAEHFVEPELVRWRSFDDRIILVFHNPPPERFTGKRPAIINMHGGPEGQARPWFQGANNYFLNELGISIIFPNVRGSSGYGKTFLTLDNGFLREESYKDIGALLDWMHTRPDLDTDRIMVTGVSYGGHMTLAVATYYADRIRCALDIVCPSNLVTFLENTSSYRRDLRRVEYGDERDPKMREFLNRIAPLNNAAKITKPLFVVQGGNDPRVPLSESVQIVEAVRKNGIPVWYLMAKDEGHGF